ncbi:MAG: hypothetical protein HPY83_16515 [Anaerolineae bacterium]|nr:hypothetical protein [Anaerolineae bacterium]
MLLVLLSPLASSFPDGLERVAEDLGFIDRAQDPAYETLPDYTVPGVASEGLSTILAGAIGVTVVFGVTWGIGTLLKRPKTAGETVAPGPGRETG